MANFTLPSNATSIVDWFQRVDTMVNHTFGVLILLAIFMVCFLASKDYGSKRALTVSFFISAICSYLLSIVGLIPGALIALPTLGLAWSILFLD